MLTQLELFGFKSFADRTAFDFAPGITCVVGPNGSGKSNVVDSIKWILGDQSAKSLRGKEMADVIFNGSAGRKPSGVAEATLTFDNTARLLRVEADVVRVGRRLYRSGESEYLLNGAVVRLKDVKDALLGTGAGTSAYSIIEQGRVDQILQSSAATRRVVFEEAAGVSRYKNRRVDAERRLERVDQNLARLRDIVQEVQSQLATTRSQATKATRFREISAELRELWTGFAADEYRRLTAAADECDGRNAELRLQLDEIQAERERHEASQAAIESALQEADDQFRQRQRERSANRELIAARDSTIRHQSARQREMDSEIAELRQERRNLSVRARAVSSELQATAASIDELEQSLAQQQQQLDDRQQEAQRLQADATAAGQTLAARRTRRQELLQLATESENRSTVLTAQRDDLQQTLHGAEERVGQLAEAVDDAEAELDVRRTHAEHASQQFQQQVGNVNRLHAERLRLIEEQGHSENSMSAMREQRIAWDARLHILEGLEQRQEGLALGVREVLHRARTAGTAPWNQIVECVGDLFDVPLEHAALLEVALGARAQLIVTRDLRGLSDYLNSGRGGLQGRVGFIEAPEQQARAETDRSSVDDAVDLTGQPGVVARADRLASEPEHIRGLAARLLGTTWIVENLSAARRLAAGNPDCRFVTLQGELLEPGGILHAGLTPQETSVVSRRSELRQLRIDLRRLDEEIAEHVRELTALVRNLTSLDGDFNQAESDRQLAARAQDEARVLLEAQQREVDRLRKLLDQARGAQQETVGRHAALEAEIARSIAVAEQCRAGAETENTALHELESHLRDAEGLLSEIREESSRQHLELTRRRERALSLRDVQSRLERDQAQRDAQSRQADSRLAAAVGTRRDLTLKILDAESDVAGFALVSESLDSALLQVDAERRSLRTHRTALAQDLDRLHRDRRTLTDEIHSAELQLREMRHEIAAWEARIDEEFQLKLSDLAAAGASALATLSVAAPDNGAEPPAGSADDDGDELPTTHQLADASDAERRHAIEEHVQRLRRKLKALGHVNTESLESLDELESRGAHLGAQLQDLVEAKTALEEIIRRINGESRRLFTETFEVIRGHFRELFRKLFGGGEADIILEDPNDVLECGIDIVARPPGKELRSISLLSGGEKTLTAIALLFAMFKSKPSPYCILDEVDAALDEANVERYASILGDFIQMTQFIVITHRKRTMTSADVIYGVTMEQAGVSKRMSVRFEDVSDNGEIRSRGGRAA
ncbi:MAG: chromosome segregation protein SMC [Planctomycetaceae bacterium]|nr:chromosome segregation protein SMC [Planctomycetaceae bacterium]